MTSSEDFSRPEFVYCIKYTVNPKMNSKEICLTGAQLQYYTIEVPNALLAQFFSNRNKASQNCVSPFSRFEGDGFRAGGCVLRWSISPTSTRILRSLAADWSVNPPDLCCLLSNHGGSRFNLKAEQSCPMATEAEVTYLMQHDGIHWESYSFLKDQNTHGFLWGQHGAFGLPRGMGRHRAQEGWRWTEGACNFDAWPIVFSSCWS